MPGPFAEQEKVTEFPYAFKVFLHLSVGLTILSFVYAIVSRYMNLGLPYSFPYLYSPGGMFSDFLIFIGKFHHWGTPAYFDHEQSGYFMYPSPLVHVFRFFSNLPRPQTCYLLTLLGVSASLGLAFIQVLRKQGLATMQSTLFVGSTAFLSYPLILDFQRGNIEFLVWLVSTVGVWCFFIGRTKTSAIFIGLAASLKFYPFIFLGLFLPRRKYGGFLLGLAAFAAVTLISLHGVGPTIAAASRWNSEQIAAFSKYYVGGISGVGYDHSFFGLVKAFTLPWHPNYFSWARPYTITVAVISVALYFLRIWRLPLPNQILALSVLSVTLAPVSYDYTLLNLYPAFAMLVVLTLQAQRQGGHVPHITAYMILFAIILTPESYIIYHAVRYGAQVRTICLIIMLGLALITPISEFCDGRQIQLGLNVEEHLASSQ
jgi:Glycosyltransferase family 87